MALLNNNTLLVVPDNLKEKTLLEISKNGILSNAKVMNITAFLHSYYFNYNEETIYYLIKTYNLKYDIALIYIKNLYFIENKIYNSPKLNKLVSIKKELYKQGLLIHNPLFKAKLKNTEIIFFGFKYTSKFNQKLIDDLNMITKVKVMNDNTNNNYVHNIYELDNIDEELEFVITNICELIKNGIDINNIILLNVTDEYLIPLKRIASYFKLPINIPTNNSIYGTKIGQCFLNKLNSNIDITLNLIKDNFKLDAESLDIYNKLVTISNKYIWCSDSILLKEMIMNELKNTKISQKKFDKAVRIETLESYIPNDSDYAFLINFNQGNIPIVEKDEDFIGDSIKDEVGLENTVEKNVIHSKIILELIRNIQKLWITYKNNGSSGKIEISSLNEKLNYPIIRDNKINYSYSNLNNILKLGKELDLYLKYGIKSDTLRLLYPTYSDIRYRSYDNKFTGIINDYDNLTLSYSSIDNYFKCSFRYYINSILKLNIYEENFMNYIGSLFHFVLSKKNTSKLDDAWNEFLQEHPKEFTNKEQFFLDKLKIDLAFIIDTISSQRDYTSFTREKYEQRIEIDKEGGTKFIGIVDKLLFNKDESLVSIIDYKTGNTPLSLNYLPYGLGMQLPIYLYLIKHEYPKVDIVGFYLQKILPCAITIDPIKTLVDQKRGLLKLQGYSLSDEGKLEQFDKTYVDSQLIKSMKKGNNGFYAYSKTLTNNNMDNIIEIIDKNINTAIKNIRENNFSINPKQIGKDNVGCSFCKFRDICYMNEKDIIKLAEIDNLDFLGGEENAQMD